jgi:hypothetical protein
MPKAAVGGELSSLATLAKFKHFLHVLRDGGPTIQTAIIKSAPPELISALCQISLNLLNGNIEISAQSREDLRMYKTLLRNLAYVKEGRGNRTQVGAGKRKKATWLRGRRRYLIQRGGGAFLTALLSAALSGIVGKIMRHGGDRTS